MEHSATFTLPQALERSREILDVQTERFFLEFEKEASKVDSFTVALAQRIHEYATHSGKAARPLLVAIGAALSQSASLKTVLAQEKVQRAMFLAEITHKRILMADDVADQDEQRHGFPTFHLQWLQDLEKDSKYAPLTPEQREHLARSYTEIAGIVFQNLGYYLLSDSEFSHQERQGILKSLQMHTYNPTVTGWYLQIRQNILPINEVSEQDLYRCYELITGEYSFVNPLQLGALLGPKTENFTEAFMAFGLPAGVLFQITDDLIGVFGDTKVTGKPVGNDFREGKKSLLVQYAYAQASSEQKKFLDEVIGNQAITPEQTKQVMRLLQETGSEKYSRQQAQVFAEEANQALQALPSGEGRELLQQLVAFIVGREK